MTYIIIFLILILLIIIYKAFIDVKKVSECCKADLWYDIIKEPYCTKCKDVCKTKLIVKFKNKWYERIIKEK
jgi:hypothetical protein